MVRFYREPLSYYVDLLEKGQPFSFAGFSDAEWFCILHHRLGCPTSLGQILHGPTGDKLGDVICRRHQDPRFMLAVPSCIWDLNEEFEVTETAEAIEVWLSSRNIPEITFWERDIVLDDAAKHAELYPLIHQLQKMPTAMIGNEHLRDLSFFKHVGYVPIPTPNMHLERGALGRVVNGAFKLKDARVFLISAGVSAALIIDRLHDLRPDCTFIDCGSIWDAFVGIGGQREWRRKLYANPEKLLAWRRLNLTGEDSDDYS